MQLSKIKPNPANPRNITDNDYQRLISSIKEFPKMMKLRPMIVDNNYVVLGGNMRLKALHELGYKEIPDEWVKQADELTDAEKKRFIIQDNISGGTWDYEALTAEWDIDELEDWGLNMPEEWENNEDIVEKTDIDESCNFIIKCSNITELEKIQQVLKVNTNNINFETFMKKTQK